MGSFRGTIYGIGGLFLLLGVGPVILSVMASWIAVAAGCDIREKTQEDQVIHCFIGGGDWGEWLYALSLLRWMVVFSLPVAAIGAAIIGLRVIIDLRRRH